MRLFATEMGESSRRVVRDPVKWGRRWLVLESSGLEEQVSRAEEMCFRPWRLVEMGVLVG